MPFEELFLDLLKAETEDEVTDALTLFNVEKFSDSNWLPYGFVTVLKFASFADS